MKENYAMESTESLPLEKKVLDNNLDNKNVKSEKANAEEKIGQAFRLQNLSADYGFNVWTLTFDLPGEKVNKLGTVVLEEFGAVLTRLEELGEKTEIEALILLSGKPGVFIAGADIKMIQSAKNAEEAEKLSRLGHELSNRWEDLKFPTIAAMNGAALGGGLELALASSARVASNDSSVKLGLPEVMLGLLPGMGGCIRLPRQVGIAGALDLILTGKSLDGTRAFKMGLIEACIPKENFEDSAIRWTQKNLKALQAGERIARAPKLGGMGGLSGSVLEKTPMGRGLIFSQARKKVLSQSKGHYPAPLEAIDVIRSSGVKYEAHLRAASRDQALKKEAKGFGKLAVTEVSKNLIRLFFMTEDIKKTNGISADSKVEGRSVRFSGVLGAGVMGGGIAQLFAEKDITTKMKDLNHPALEMGVDSAMRVFDKKLKRRRITQREMLQKLNHISPTLNYDGFKSLDFVVEAVVENMEIKKKVLSELEREVEDDCVIASNTSSLSVTEMQSAMKKPERFAGMHFFNPVHKMPLVEVIRGEKSSDEAVATVFELSKKLGKMPVVVKDAPGFLVNRLLMPYLNEASYMLSEGVPIPELDRVMVRFGMPMGPMELVDEVGLDVADKVAKILFDAFGERAKPALIAGKVSAAERLGKKNGKGLYKYKKENGKIKKELDFQIYQIIEVKPRPGFVSEKEIIERCLLPMINEACLCLDEEVVKTSSEIDLAMIMGTGFPPFRGGLMRYAESLGPRHIVERLNYYEARHGARFKPSAYVLRKAEREESFYEN
jgi:3-hydroxyacyl-CoA dehydrogenase / enoyl-CoA hydratase / 3-hydroxybutyryl-CoA epimerase